MGLVMVSAAAVADDADPSVQLFDHKGVRVRSIARAGDGPGEFRNPRWPGECRTGVLTVFDRRHDRLTVFSIDGVRRHTQPLTPHTTRASVPGQYACGRRHYSGAGARG